MKCIYCGFEHPEPFQFCPNCGTDNRYTVPVNLAVQQLLHALKSNLFLVICILLSVSSAFSLTSGAVPVITALIAIFLWIIFSQSRKNTIDSRQLKNISGTVYASYIINFVLGGLFILLGVAFVLLFILAAAEPDMYSAFMEGFIEGLELSGMSIHEFEDILDEIGMGVEGLAAVIGLVFFFVFTLAGVATIIINALGMGKIHRLAKSAYKSVESSYLNLEKVTAAKNWLFVFGVFSAISALSTLISGDFLAAIAGGTDSAAMICAGILVNKFFISASAAPQNENI